MSVQPLISSNDNDVSAYSPKALLKWIITAATISGLVATTIFTGQLALEHLHSAPIWGDILLGGLAVGSIISTIGSVFFAYVNNMHKNTDENLKDTVNYLKNTFMTVFLSAAVVLVGAVTSYYG